MSNTQTITGTLRTMIIKTDGVVIREQTAGERDRLVTLLTRKLGVIRAFVNGVRSPKSRNAASTGLLCYSDFVIEQKKNGVYTVTEASAKEVFFSLREDIVSLSLAQYFAELAYELSVREEEADEFLRLLLNAVFFVAQNKRSKTLVKAATELRFLSLAGYMPSIVGCARCGKFESETMQFSPRSGRLYCSDCVPGEKTVALPLGIVTAMRHICLSEPGKVFSFSLSKPSELLLGEVSEQYLKNITMRKYKTLDFYKSITE